MAKKTKTIEPQKKKRGRPKMTDEQKAEARARREAEANGGEETPAPRKRRARVVQEAEVASNGNEETINEIKVLMRATARLIKELV